MEHTPLSPQDHEYFANLVLRTTNIVTVAAHRATGDLRTHLPDSRELTHYTTTAGAQGIIESNSLWATSPLYLNDAHELTHIGTPLDQAWTNVRDAFGEGHFGVDWILNVLEGHRGKPVNGAIAAEEQKVYVASFCEDPDLLSQWRGYGGTQGGPAYSVTFDAEALRHLRPYSPGMPPAPLQGGDVSLVKANYDPDSQTEVLTNLLTEVCHALIAELRHTQDKANFQLIRLLSEHLHSMIRLTLSAVFKHPGFKEEDEWRLVVGGGWPQIDPDPEYRSTSAGLAPYFHLGIPEYHEAESDYQQYVTLQPLPITRVTQGPSTAGDLALTAMQGLLHKHGYEKATTSTSLIPYRAP